ncbi:LysE family translocator [Pseudoalteromonas sp. DL2-H2.2]|uniref:LysE family translocator n=1 Tax=Pseudoalteromonas sp. DL2-H2.2 TaxID=2908889 RepID=UPI001F2849D5|nr:LysE family translocator [Pseudoalteromonas sp. DL2-H2.2]MCF2907103.1 LysE family translocator [Pseudoalteromonas sp. DL2-H2.2]
MTFEHYLALFIAMFLVAVIPGPGVFAITSASIARGLKQGVNMTVGLLLADYLFILLAISGLAVVAEVLGSAFVIIKYLCAAYLIWMGISLLRAKPGTSIAEPKMQSTQSAVLSGFLLTLSNPKAIVFYVALFPTFVAIENMTYPDILGIMACATLAFGSVNLGYVYLGSQARKLLTTPRRLTLLNRCAGSVLAASGVTVAVR